jgi:chromosome segregation ATPase
LEIENIRVETHNKKLQQEVTHLNERIKELEAKRKENMYSHNFMEVKVNERDKELLLLAESFDRMKAQNENLKEKLGSQEFEMGSLFKCIEHLRQ